MLILIVDLLENKQSFLFFFSLEKSGQNAKQMNFSLESLSIIYYINTFSATRHCNYFFGTTFAHTHSCVHGQRIIGHFYFPPGKSIITATGNIMYQYLRRNPG